MRDLTSRFGPPYPAALSDYLTFTLPPNVTVAGQGFGVITTNSMGYRGRFPRGELKDAGVRRLMLLGDSYTLGWGLPEHESIAGRLQSWLDGQGGQWEVINAAYHAGCSPDAYYAYLKKEGLALSPDVLVVIIYTANDVEDMRDNVWTSVDDNSGPETLYSIRTYTDYRGRLLNPALLPWYYRLPLLNESRVFLNAAALATRVASGVGVPGSGRLGRPLPETEAWNRFSIVARATARLARARAIPLFYVVLSTPGVGVYDDPNLERTRTLLEQDLDVPLLVLHDRLGPEHAIPGDGHLNTSGARIAASALEQFLVHTVTRLDSGDPSTFDHTRYAPARLPAASRKTKP